MSRAAILETLDIILAVAGAAIIAAPVVYLLLR